MFESASFCNGQKKCLKALVPVIDNERFERASSFNEQKKCLRAQVHVMDKRNV